MIGQKEGTAMTETLVENVIGSLTGIGSVLKIVIGNVIGTGIGIDIGKTETEMQIIIGTGTEEEHRSKSRDADYGKRRRLTSE
ncbi:hypothetical protein CRYUN_Cryun13aG0032600 [Craigia yunnanensis]